MFIQIPTIAPGSAANIRDRQFCCVQRERQGTMRNLEVRIEESKERRHDSAAEYEGARKNEKTAYICFAGFLLEPW